jgi:hypothetical protein
MSNTQEAPKLVEVTLGKPHTHRGESFAAGARIKVTEVERDWLQKAGVIAPIATKEKQA